MVDVIITEKNGFEIIGKKIGLEILNNLVHFGKKPIKMEVLSH